jgi:dimethylhistidine N-methyltransferase
LLPQVSEDQQNFVTALPDEKNNPAEDILKGLQKEQKELPTKYFYDERGSKLFDQICTLDAYYLTRTEIGILSENIDEIVGLVEPRPIIIEFGSGSSAKTRILLDHLTDVTAYMPVDIASEQLSQTVEALREEYPEIEIISVNADYTRAFNLPLVDSMVSNKLAFFPGSSLGNFYPEEAAAFMDNVGQVIGPGGGFLIGVDLQKDHEVLNRAYNDPVGLTAAFNLNMLVHINRTASANFDPDKFTHHAFYNCGESRIEMHLISKSDQTVQLAGEDVFIRAGENILTEVSYKYSLESFTALAAKAGFETRKTWLDSKKYFSVHYLVRN